jgi:hypothetical protein
MTMYKNGSSFDNPSNTSGSLSNANFYIFNANGTSDFSTHQLSAAFIGGGMNATQAGNVQSRINAYMTALGVNVY